MKVPSDPAGSSAPPSRTGEPPASESRSFDNVLERKSQERKGKNNGGKPGARGLEDDAMPSAAIGPMVISPMRDMAPSAVAKAADVPEVRDVDGLVHEILVVAGPGTNHRVEVQFHSKTLEGLNVQISKNGDEISIRFLTNSNSVAQLLSRKSDQLTQGLEMKGLQVAPIQIELTPPSPRFTDSRPSSSRDSRRDRGSDQQQQRQKE